MSPALIALLPFFGALLPGLLNRSGRGVAATACGAVTLLALIGLCLHIPAVLAGQAVATRIDWLPAVGLSANFRLDGLGLLFGLLILGIGLLIITYARFYLAQRDPAGQFLTYLMLFQGAMMGIVLSDNILLLLVFWELTSLSSFLLIGYWRHQADARAGARMALTITGLGGLAMIAGMLILGQIAGSYEISQILTQREAIQASPLYLPALLLILLGAFTKSAQFPFHFWLPRAMAAPTPVSAYLHSATMVKAGIFLMARFWPVLSGTPEWFYIVMTTGLVTMVLGALIAIFQDDLKALLAYSTVSHLGLITMLLGIGTTQAATAAMFHIVNHAIFKAALFMVAGIIDHETGSRLITRLGGLRRLMPVTFVIALVGTLAMAGLPPFNGFISKEMMLESVLSAANMGPGQWLVVVATIGAGLSVCYSLRMLWHVFMGPQRKDYPQAPHDPGIGLWGPPALLAALAVLVGLNSQYMAGWLVQASSGAVTGAVVQTDLALWHGFGPALTMSMIAVAAGIVLLVLFAPLLAMRNALPRPDAGVMFAAVMAGAARLAQELTDRLSNGSNARALSWLVVVSLACGLWAWVQGVSGAMTRPMLPVTPVALIGWLLLVVASIAAVVAHQNRLMALVMVGIVGLMVTGGFVYLSAPDLALTQFSVEVVTVMMMMMALNFLPKRTPSESRPARRGFDAMLAGLAGLGFGGLAYAILRSDFSLASMSGYMVENSYKLGGGTNVVNVILVDFRGYDTFGEITVLGIAALAIFAMTETLLAGPAAARLAERRRGSLIGAYQAGDRHPLMLSVITRMVLPMALVVGLYIFLRGHNLPGGGFVSALVVSVAVVMQYMASGYDWADARKSTAYHNLIGAGVMAAVITGAGAWLMAMPFLTSAFGYFKLPFLEEIELATALGFDLGVFLCVVGAVMLAMECFGRLGQVGRSGVKTADAEGGR